MRNPEDVRHDLIQLIQQAQNVSPKLASRLDEMNRWIAQKKSGLLMRKKYVMQLLAELIADTSFWLNVQFLPEEDREPAFAELSPVERYWYKHLFPAWFNEKDPKLNIWKKKLMAGEFTRDDATFIDTICSEIELRGGYNLNPYIADLSMATDFITSGKKALILCVQLTSLQNISSTDKQDKWESTLKHWRIQRGLFVSYNPRQEQINIEIAERVFRDSDLLPKPCYSKVNIDL